MGENRDLYGRMLKCPTLGANQLRELSWGVPIIGVTKSPWMHQCIVKNMDDCTEEERESGITVRVSGQALDNPTQCHKMYGPMRPFIGATTKEKVNKKPVISIQEKSNFAKALLKLIRVRSWIERIGDRNTLELCKKLMDEKRALISIEDYDWGDVEDNLGTAVGGNLFHRFKSSIDRDTAMINCLPSVTGHFEYSSNSMKRLTAGGKDHNVFFQYIYTAATESFAMVGRDTGELNPMYMILFSDCDCFHETPNPELRMDNPSSGVKDIPIVGENLIVSNLGSGALRNLMSVQVGLELASNIDENYRLSHQQGDITISSSDYKKQMISINDMRQLDLEVILINMSLFSKHCRSLFFKRDDILLALSEDRSFLYVAELILESNLVPKLLELIGKKTNEHGGVTAIFGISSYISRNVGFFILNQLQRISELSLIRFREDLSITWIKFFRFVAKAANQISFLPGGNRDKMWSILRTDKNIFKLTQVSSIKINFEGTSRAEILTGWKLSDRGSDIGVDFRIVPIGIHPGRVERFPMADVMSYHYRRAFGRETGLQVPQISFIARPLGAISSGGCKAAETMIATGIAQELMTSTGFLYTMAEGSGSIAVVLATLFPKMRVIYNTWMRPDISHRDLATDTSIPAWVDLRQDPDRIVQDKTLITGQTDITHPRFTQKMRQMVQKYPPNLITMDAESTVTTNNIQFLDHFVIPLLDKVVCYFFVKLFHMIDLRPILEEKLRLFSTYSWVLYKPISSNPVGPEIYLILIPKDKENQQFLDCQSMQTNLALYLRPDMSMSKRSFEAYVEVAKRVSSVMRDIFPDRKLEIPHKYQDKTRDTCGLLCINFLNKLMHMVDVIHMSSDNELVHIATRSKGINTVLYHLIHELIFLYFFHTSKYELYTILGILNNCKVVDNIEECRKKGAGYVTIVEQGGKDFWGTWKDARMYMREIGKATRICCCPPIRMAWTWDTNHRVNPTRTLSWQVYSSLYKIGRLLPNWDLFDQLRTELRLQYIGQLPSSICNEERSIDFSYVLEDY